MTEENKIKERGPGPLMMSVYIILFLIIVAVLFITVVFSPWYYGKEARVMATKTIHAQTVKYISAELQKCSLGETSIMDATRSCTGITGSNTATAAVAALKDKNPYVGASDAHRTSGNNTADTDVGYITITAVDKTITIKSCHQTACSVAANQNLSTVSLD